MKKLAPPLILVTLATVLSAQADTIKKSKSNICHDNNSPFYDRVKNYKAFNTLKSCLDSGGRLPKRSNTYPSAQKHSKPLSKIGYSRSEFGNGWDDADGDCVNTRHELLMKQSTGTVDRGSNKCTAVRGRWYDPYTGKTFYKAHDVDIDHLVPLKWAWDHGANTWTFSKREQFANDQTNLFAVEASVNRQKGAQGPIEWLPPLKSFQCQYVVRFQRVVLKYGLKLSISEKNRINTIKSQICK